MANDNICYFTGQVKWYKERKISATFGVINTRVHLPVFQFEHQGQQFKVDNPFVWLSIKVSYADTDAVDRILDSCDKQRYVTIAGANVTDYLATSKDSNGVPIPGAPQIRKFSLEVSQRSVSFSDRPLIDLNTCIVSGKVEEVDGNWITIKTWYKVKKDTKYRHIEVISDSPIVANSLIGSNIAVVGQICGKDPKNNERLYIAADKITVT